MSALDCSTPTCSWLLSHLTEYTQAHTTFGSHRRGRSLQFLQVIATSGPGEGTQGKEKWPKTGALWGHFTDGPGPEGVSILVSINKRAVDEYNKGLKVEEQLHNKLGHTFQLETYHFFLSKPSLSSSDPPSLCLSVTSLIDADPLPCPEGSKVAPWIEDSLGGELEQWLDEAKRRMEKEKEVKQNSVTGFVRYGQWNQPELGLVDEQRKWEGIIGGSRDDEEWTRELRPPPSSHFESIKDQYFASHPEITRQTPPLSLPQAQPQQTQTPPITPQPDQCEDEDEEMEMDWDQVGTEGLMVKEIAEVEEKEEVVEEEVVAEEEEMDWNDVGTGGLREANEGALPKDEDQVDEEEEEELEMDWDDFGTSQIRPAASSSTLGTSSPLRLHSSNPPLFNPPSLSPSPPQPSHSTSTPAPSNPSPLPNPQQRPQTWNFLYGYSKSYSLSSSKGLLAKTKANSWSVNYRNLSGREVRGEDRVGVSPPLVEERDVYHEEEKDGEREIYDSLNSTHVSMDLSVVSENPSGAPRPYQGGASGCSGDRKEKEEREERKRVRRMLDGSSPVKAGSGSTIPSFPRPLTNSSAHNNLSSPASSPPKPLLVPESQTTPFKFDFPFSQSQAQEEEETTEEWAMRQLKEAIERSTMGELVGEEEARVCERWIEEYGVRI